MDLVPEAVRAVMAELEARDRADTVQGTPQEARLRSISPEVGQFLLTLALSIEASKIVGMDQPAATPLSGWRWLPRTGVRRVTTFEIDGAKCALARRTFTKAGVSAFVELREADAIAGLAGLDGPADMVFIDAEKRDYVTYLELALRILRPGGLLVADNLLSHAGQLVEFRARALSEPRLTGLVVPIGARRAPRGAPALTLAHHNGGVCGAHHSRDKVEVKCARIRSRRGALVDQSASISTQMRPSFSTSYLLMQKTMVMARCVQCFTPNSSSCCGFAASSMNGWWSRSCRTINRQLMQHGAAGRRFGGLSPSPRLPTLLPVRRPRNRQGVWVGRGDS